MKMKKASSFFFWLLRLVFIPTLRCKYRFKFDRKNSKPVNSAKLKRPCLILSNHQTTADQFTVGTGFTFGINYVASDSIFRHGFLSKLMVWLAHPIPISKGSMDATAVKNIMTAIKDGSAVGMFPSGNTSFFGEECFINPAVGKLCKKLGVPVVLVRQEGGYFTAARWKNKISKGRYTARVARVIEPDELASLSPEEIFSAIKDTLYHNEYEWNKTARVRFKGKRKAEYLESVLFYCPKCRSLHALRSEKNDLFCTECGARVTLNDYGFFEGADMPETALAWSRAQLDYIKSLDYSLFTDKPVFNDGGVKLSLVTRATKEEALGTGEIALYGDRIAVFADIISRSRKLNGSR